MAGNNSIEEEIDYFTSSDESERDDDSGDEIFALSDSETEISESDSDIEAEDNLTAVDSDFYQSKDKTIQYFPYALPFGRPIASSLFRAQPGKK